MQCRKCVVINPLNMKLFNRFYFNITITPRFNDSIFWESVNVSLIVTYWLIALMDGFCGHRKEWVVIQVLLNENSARFLMFFSICCFIYWFYKNNNRGEKILENYQNKRNKIFFCFLTWTFSLGFPIIINYFIKSVLGVL